jgi:hypothetical protein
MYKQRISPSHPLLILIIMAQDKIHAYAPSKQASYSSPHPPTPFIIHANTHIHTSSRGTVRIEVRGVCVGGRRWETTAPRLKKRLRVGTCSATISSAISIFTAPPLHNKRDEER